MAFINEEIGSGNIALEFVPYKDQKADIITKALKKIEHKRQTDLIMYQPPEAEEPSTAAAVRPGGSADVYDTSFDTRRTSREEAKRGNWTRGGALVAFTVWPS